MSLESTIKVEVLDREKKFIQASFEFSENSVFYATNPNHEDENFFVIDSLIKYGAWDTIIVSPHPRENIENYISKYANSNVVVTKEKVSGCKNYIFRPSTIIVEALEESIRPIVYISDMDRVEHYVDSKKSLVVLGQHEFKNLIRSKSYE